MSIRMGGGGSERGWMMIRRGARYITIGMRERETVTGFFEKSVNI
jgi:hypothetical protein